MDLSTIQDTVLQLLDGIEHDCERIPAHKLGLDPRAGRTPAACPES